MFLLWDAHSKLWWKWYGHTRYYKPKKNQSIDKWIHWIFADQAYNFHKKKTKAARDMIDAWIEACKRAQQAIVADRKARFTGKPGYTKVWYTFGATIGPLL